MKKSLFLGLVLAAVAVGGAFALPEFRLSAGAGGYFTSDFGGGFEGSLGPLSMSGKTPYYGGGGFAFLDATYAELSLGFFGAGMTTKSEMTGSDPTEEKGSLMGLDIGLMGKYPIAMSEKLTLFPQLGIGYRIVLSAKDKDGNQGKDAKGNENAGDYSALWFRLGGGVDFSFTDSLYLRGGLLYGLRLSNKFEKDMVDEAKDNNLDAKTLLGHGLEVKVALGYRF